MKLLLVAFHASDVGPGAAFARGLGIPFDVLSVDGRASEGFGADSLIRGNLDHLPPADAMARAIADLGDGYSHVAAVSSMASKDAMARAAGLMDAAMVTDVVAVISPTQFVRPIYAGAMFATVEALSGPVVMTFRPSGFPAPEATGASAVVEADLKRPSKVRQVATNDREGARPDLTQAKVIVSGGRPLKDAGTFERIVGGLADRLGGAVGATRAAVDSGIAPNELQVGQTGKIVSPDLYIAAGISGSTQHMAGIKDSKTIVAINTDPDAPIFEFADFGLVQDLFVALPELQSKV